MAQIKRSSNGQTAMRRVRRASVPAAAFAAALLLLHAGAARAGDDASESSQPFYARILESIGVLPSGSNIDYSARSPLVIPPTKDLPPPQADAPPAVADWPKDPDMTRRAKAKAAAERVTPHPDYAVELARPLRPGELNNIHGGASSGSRPTPGGISAADYPEKLQKPGKGLFSFDWLKKEQYATFTGEPARAHLTDPPPGYRTPSPDQPYGISPEEKPYKIQTVGDRPTLHSGSAEGN